MEIMRQEVHEFSSASEKLLGYDVTLEELSVMERDVIQYYLSAIGEKFAAPSKAVKPLLIRNMGTVKTDPSLMSVAIMTLLSGGGTGRIFPPP
jgi:hypothetical protein